VSTRDTVAVETPARAATSAIVTAWPSELDAGRVVASPM
jgi:hypothetical protein